MKGSRNLNEGKSKDHQAALISSVGELRRVAEGNHLRLQHLELAVTNLTYICNSIRKDICSLGLSDQGLFRKVHGEGIDTRPTFATRSEKKGNMLGVQMRQLVEQAAALGILKDPKTTEDMKANQGKPARPAPKNVQAATEHQKRSTRSRIQTTELTTDKKMSMKLAGIKNNMGATQPKGPRKNSAKATTTANVSLKSTVKKTKTTISKVYVGSTTKRDNETAKGSVSVKSSIKKVETVKGQGTIKLMVKANQGDNHSHSAAKSGTRTLGCTSGAPVKSDLKARRKWSTTKEITVK
ncbi:hypothetical protein Cgig2_024005 [Carnegiea gigantea]|uniref:Uncharacterized protein n=1 Tax=Carnegiea gigantea TaxID=171969 RepID=A0A9Q1KB56_9CARY|nr:hypothetical protein Cgig2_024005 [Carnegiea gigantea]